ncbi:MAG: c-type cytochrome [Acidobacteriota bacterium]
MKALALLLGVIGFTVPMLWISPRLAEGQQLLQGEPAIGGPGFIDRRHQATGAFLATAEEIYRHYCSHCHGEDATGGGRLWASELSPEPPDLTTLEADEAYLVAAIRDGSATHGKSNLCPPWGRTISPPDVQRLARYLLELGGQSSPVRDQTAAASDLQRQPFPWLLMLVVFGEIAILWRMLYRQKEGSNAIP